jgi:hypothetical protein
LTVDLRLELLVWQALTLELCEGPELLPAFLGGRFEHHHSLLSGSLLEPSTHPCCVLLES